MFLVINEGMLFGHSIFLHLFDAILALEVAEV